MISCGSTTNWSSKCITTDHDIYPSSVYSIIRSASVKIRTPRNNIFQNVLREENKISKTSSINYVWLYLEFDTLMS